MLLFVYTTTRKRFVIFTCRYFKLSWNTAALSQSNCRNFSCSSSAAKNFPQTQTSEPASRLGCYMWQTLEFCSGKNNEMAQQEIIDKENTFFYFLDFVQFLPGTNVMPSAFEGCPVPDKVWKIVTNHLHFSSVDDDRKFASADRPWDKLSKLWNNKL